MWTMQDLMPPCHHARCYHALPYRQGSMLHPYHRSGSTVTFIGLAFAPLGDRIPGSRFRAAIPASRESMGEP
jgi:hypothetical protein